MIDILTLQLIDQYSKPNFVRGFTLLCWSVDNFDRHKRMTIYLFS